MWVGDLHYVKEYYGEGSTVIGEHDMLRKFERVLVKLQVKLRVTKAVKLVKMNQQVKQIKTRSFYEK